MYTTWLVLENRIQDIVSRALNCYRRKHRMVLDGAREIEARVEYCERQVQKADDYGLPYISKGARRELAAAKRLRTEFLDRETQNIIDVENAIINLLAALEKMERGQ